MIAREEALNLIKKYIRNKDRLKASLAVEAILKKLARRFEEDEKLWSLTGLLHNLDYEYTEEDQQNRGKISTQILDGLIPDEAMKAIQANNYINTDYLPETSLDKALIAAEAAACLIISTINASYTHDVEDIDIRLLYENFKDESFAPNCNRDRIKLCNDNELDVQEFLSICLEAFVSIKDKLSI